MGDARSTGAIDPVGVSFQKKGVKGEAWNNHEGRCSFHVHNSGLIQATPKSKVTSKLGRTTLVGARSMGAVEPARVPFQRRGYEQAWRELF